MRSTRCEGSREEGVLEWAMRVEGEWRGRYGVREWSRTKAKVEEWLQSYCNHITCERVRVRGRGRNDSAGDGGGSAGRCIGCGRNRKAENTDSGRTGRAAARRPALVRGVGVPTRMGKWDNGRLGPHPPNKDTTLAPYNTIFQLNPPDRDS
ncbi:hypothetical protein EVAR_32494_1 [Eumeta japonica]|uniref:Uncharacterized protein n=1 Tax=Eumeta variegata TaxID=151549 RepID=A0A4C1WA07_EUMVA|nr:hypothetical protein EVAR_32494_1 [Eumeta japonica]